jgi:hypothetical protein
VGNAPAHYDLPIQNIPYDDAAGFYLATLSRLKLDAEFLMFGIGRGEMV